MSATPESGHDSESVTVVQLDPKLIEDGAEAKATVTDDGVVRIGWARTDVTVKVDGMPLQPFAGLGSCLHGLLGATRDFQGPQSTGLLAGRADLIEAARLQNAPNDGIGRGMKVAKEEIVDVEPGG